MRCHVSFTTKNIYVTVQFFLGNNLNRYSKVLDSRLGRGQAKDLPVCHKYIWSEAQPLNASSSGDLYNQPKLLWIGQVCY